MMIDYKENLINENSELNQYDPITKLMKYRMLSNEDGTTSRKRTHKIDKF